jgi:hypothetical protein
MLLDAQDRVLNNLAHKAVPYTMHLGPCTCLSS